MSTEIDDLLESEGAGYLVSVSDIMSGLLFVFIITLMAFVLQFHEAKAEQKAKIEQLTNNQKVRAELLKDIKEALMHAGIPIEIDPKTGVLLLTENTVPFALGQAKPLPQGETNLRIIADVLAKIIPCYAHEPPDNAGCTARQRDKLEAIFVEGHTDSTPMQRHGYSNWNLSSDRAINSFQVLRAQSEQLESLGNSRGQPLFSVSGYAALRPRRGMPSDDPRQRRIELRFIMTPPSGDKEVEPVHDINAQGIR